MKKFAFIYCIEASKLAVMLSVATGHKIESKHSHRGDMRCNPFLNRVPNYQLG